MNKLAISRDLTEGDACPLVPDTMAEAAGCGLIGIDKDNVIRCANHEGKQIMGLPDRGKPLKWPAGLMFYDADEDALLPKDQDPVALSDAGNLVDVRLYAAVASLIEETTDNRRLLLITVRRTVSHPLLRYIISMQDVTTMTAQRNEAEALRRLDALGETTGSIAHDFNNVLGAIMPSIQLAIHKTDDPAVRELLDRALESTRSGAVLSKRLLSFARAQPSLNEVSSVSDVFDTVRTLAERGLERSIRLKFNDYLSGTNIVCDRGRLETVLLNLVFNARDAIQSERHSGTIIVSARTVTSRDDRDQMVEISVSDDGSGMNDLTLRRAIDPLFTTRNHSGGGLGLSIAYGFCRQAGGGLDIQSKLGEGTTVRMKLPAVDGGLPEDEADQLWISGKRASILVAEGEPQLRRSLRDVLRALDYDAQLVGDGDQALSALKDKYFEMLLTDVIMPGSLNGFELAKRALALNKEIAIAYMSGRPKGEHDIEMEVPGPMIMKPCEIGTLSQILHQIRNKDGAKTD
ncbi:MAG: ATP-binding protein [Pseudomonadota bacterium]